MNCNFGSKERLEEMLRNRLVCGINHQGIQRLSEGDISYTDALPLAQSIESAEARWSTGMWTLYVLGGTVQIPRL